MKAEICLRIVRSNPSLPISGHFHVRHINMPVGGGGGPAALYSCIPEARVACVALRLSLRSVPHILPPALLAIPATSLWTSTLVSLSFLVAFIERSRGLTCRTRWLFTVCSPSLADPASEQTLLRGGNECKTGLRN